MFILFQYSFENKHLSIRTLTKFAMKTQLVSFSRPSSVVWLLVAQHSDLSQPLYKGKGSWLVIDSTEVFKSDRLKALYIMSRPDGWVRVQGWSLRIQAKALSILTMLTCRTLTWWWADFFPHALLVTPTCRCGLKKKRPHRAHRPDLTAASAVL